MEPECCVSDGYCNGSSDTHSVLAKLVDDSSSNSRVADADDVYAQFGEKESNVQLAAQLGKVLLHNEELRSINQQIIQEFSQKIELLQQEKQELHHERDAAVTDLENMQRRLDDIEAGALARQQADQQRIDELTQQNERMSEQLLTESESEERLRRQVDEMQLTVTLSDVEPDANELTEQIAALRSEKEELKAELESRLAVKTEECETLTTDLERANHRLSEIDGQTATIAEKLLESEAERRRLEDDNMQLLLKLENITMSTTESCVASSETSLFAELEMLSHSLSVDSFSNQPARPVTIGSQLKQEILEVFRQLRRLHLEVEGRQCDWSLETVDMTDLRAGQLLVTLTELRALVHRRLRLSSRPLITEDETALVDELRRQVTSLRDQLSTSQQRSNALEAELSHRGRQLVHKCDELKLAETQLSTCRTEMSALQKDRDRLLDHATGTLSPDEVLQATRADRDALNNRCVELCHQVDELTLENKALDRQLLEAVSQKLQLSEQLDAWQSDMQELIETRMADEIERDRQMSTSVTVSASRQRDTSASRPVTVTPSPTNRKRFSLRWT